MLKRTHYTQTPSANQVVREVVVLDAKDQKLGRLATQAARFLIGKHKANFTTNIDMGDYVVVVNAAQMDIPQKKMLTKEYKRYSGYQGGQKTTLLADMFEKDPGAPVKHAVGGMVPDNKLKTDRLKRLYVFGGSDYILPPDIQKLTNNDAK